MLNKVQYNLHKYYEPFYRGVLNTFFIFSFNSILTLFCPMNYTVFLSYSNKNKSVSYPKKNTYSILYSFKFSFNYIFLSYILLLSILAK